jgi:hypothetical protein
MPDRDDSSTRSWEAVAEDWVAHADQNDYRNDFLMPLTLELLGEVRGVRILDVGCGEGGHTRELAARGARVVGVDGSPRLVAIARSRAAAAGHDIDYVFDRYFERTAWDDFITARFRRPVVRRHQPLQDFVRPLLDRGFLLRDFREPRATPEQVDRSDRLRHLTRIPYFLFMSWQKPTAAARHAFDRTRRWRPEVPRR